ncbi:HAD family hydrolase [Leptolyngbya sp. FACHB-261]|uniref:HAD family hydrolase n=1 Tax=Leptolyngbya sp. FACHB-261 TaxID=2692806 RepID=UPI001682C385|nr:HAD family hydrolase [Leptolyngbya sp. FACHB-261]MBD2102915.1 HAD family hydrolase [Leptolyngbya sp. FACHB-261]
MQIRGVILDVDGTLIDSNDAHAHAWVEALAQGNHQVPFEQVRRLIGMGSDNLLPNTIGVSRDTPEGKQLSQAWQEIFESRYLPDLQPFPQTRELIQRIHEQGLKIVVATSGEASMMEALLKLAQVDEFIESETSSKDAKNSKPDPDLIQAALEKIGYHSDQVVMLGDTPYDIEAAAKAGVKTIALRCGGWQDSGLADALAIYDNPADLLAHYDSSPLGSAVAV